MCKAQMQRPLATVSPAGADEERSLLSSPDTSKDATVGRPSAFKSVAVACFYGVASIVTTLANKALLSSWGFDLVLSLLLFQNVLTVFAVGVTHRVVRYGNVGGAFSDAFAFPLWNMDTSVAMLPVMCICSLNLWAGMSALSLSSVPVYQTLKRMTPLPAMALDHALRGKTFSAAICSSVLVVCAGAFVTGCGDLDYNAHGYAFAVASCALQALYLVLAARAADTRPEISSLCAAYYNALLSLPLLALGVAYEWESLRGFPAWREPAFLAMLITDLVLGASLSLLLFMCTLTNSALTTTIVGNAKAVLTTAIGAVVFGASSKGLKPLGWLGICINTAGGVMYTVAKYREQRGRKR